jgi:hypothetical protein
MNRKRPLEAVPRRTTHHLIKSEGTMQMREMGMNMDSA